MSEHHTRREFLSGVSLVTAGLFLPPGDLSAAHPEGSNEHQPEEISPAEDLMREHGVLNRVLLIYEEVGRRLQTKTALNPGTLQSAAQIIRSFIEDYHEKLEEDYLFPRFEKAGQLTGLVKILREQHQAGRRLTARILQLAVPSLGKDAEQQSQLRDALHSFIRMYRPHEAREDTVLFPALHKIVSPHEYDALGDEFEKKERELFDHDGFEEMVSRVAKLEETLGICDLAKFTPR